MEEKDDWKLTFFGKLKFHQIKKSKNVNSEF